MQYIQYLKKKDSESVQYRHWHSILQTHFHSGREGIYIGVEQLQCKRALKKMKATLGPMETWSADSFATLKSSNMIGCISPKDLDETIRSNPNGMQIMGYVGASTTANEKMVRACLDIQYMFGYLEESNIKIASYNVYVNIYLYVCIFKRKNNRYENGYKLI